MITCSEVNNANYFRFQSPYAIVNLLDVGNCDTAVRTKYVLHVTSPVSHLTQIFHHTHVSPFPCLHTLWFSETLCVDVNILVVNYT